MIVADVHNHTNASHGKASVGEMYAAAKDRGLAVYGFSEHSPRPEAYSYPVEYREHLRQNFVRYASEVMQLRALSGSPKVLLGMELDWFPSERPFMEAAVAAYPFDYIIGGIHFLGSWGFDFTQDDWKISPQQCYTRYENYFRTLADMARSGLVDIAAHPDIIKLYSVDVFHQWLAMPESLALISEALTAIRDNGLVMEISSAGLRKPCNEIYPHPAIMKLASDLGVKISFGSDAHCPNTPAYAFDQLEAYARSYGYTSSVIFENRKPREIGFSKIGRGEGPFLQKGALSPPKPSPLPPKTFDWWGGRAEGVLFGGKAKRMQDIRHTLSVGRLPCRAGKVKRRREGRCFFVCRCHERESQDSLFSLQTFGAYCGTFASPSH